MRAYAFPIFPSTGNKSKLYQETLHLSQFPYSPKTRWSDFLWINFILIHTFFCHFLILLSVFSKMTIKCPKNSSYQSLVIRGLRKTTHSFLLKNNKKNNPYQSLVIKERRNQEMIIVDHEK